MALNFGLNKFVDPNVKIEGNQIPLEAIKYSADKLQDVYLRAQDTDTKTEAAMKQMMLSTDPVARDAAKSLYGDYQNRLQQRVQAGDYENMHQATQRDAMNLGVNMQALMNHKKEVDAVVNRTLEQKGINDPLLRKRLADDYRKQLARPTYDPESGLVGNFDVQNAEFANDFNTNEFVNKLGQGWQADAGGGGRDTYRRTADGLVEKLTSKNKWEQVKADEVTKALSAALKGEQGFNAEVNRDARLIANETGQDYETVRQGLEQQKINNALNFAVPKYSYKQSFKETSSDISDLYGVYRGGSGKSALPSFVQLGSTNFVNNAGEKPFELDTNGNITLGKTADKGIKFVRDEFGVRDPNASLGNSNTQAATLKEITSGTTYTRLKKMLIEDGKLNDKADAKTINRAIADHLNNQIALAKSSISVANPSDQAAVDYFNTINEALTGDKTPNNSKNADAILSGQFARRTYTDENGKQLTSKQLAEAASGRNVRIIGEVNQPQSPLEYGSYYMVATNPDNKETKEFLVSPDENTRNSGAYFANRVYNSQNKANTVSKWTDGNGTPFEATRAGKGTFVVYANNDKKTPMTFTTQQLDAFSQLPPEQSAAVLNQYYTEQKQKLGK